MSQRARLGTDTCSLMLPFPGHTVGDQEYRAVIRTNRVQLLGRGCQAVSCHGDARVNLHGVWATVPPFVPIETLLLGEQRSWERQADLMNIWSHRDRVLWVFPLKPKEAFSFEICPST